MTNVAATANLASSFTLVLTTRERPHPIWLWVVSRAVGLAHDLQGPNTTSCMIGPGRRVKMPATMRAPTNSQIMVVRC
jgi:hypothetical protein